MPMSTRRAEPGHSTGEGDSLKEKGKVAAVRAANTQPWQPPAGMQS